LWIYHLDALVSVLVHFGKKPGYRAVIVLNSGHRDAVSSTMSRE